MMLSDLPAQVIWKAQSGSQALFLACPFFEALYAGTRGVGKTDALIIDFVQHVNRGWGEYWTGIIFRKSYKQLQEVERKTRRLFHRLFRVRYLIRVISAGSSRWRAVVSSLHGTTSGLLELSRA
jgi:hypothetical protein